MTLRSRGRVVDVERAVVAVIGLVVGAVVVHVAGEVRQGMWELGAGGRSSDADISEAREVLRGRTTFEEVAGTAPAVLDTIVRSLDDELGAVTWDLDPVTHSSQGCTPPEHNAAPTPRGDGGLSERAAATGSVTLDRAQAVRAADIIAELGRQHGYAGAEGNRNGSGIEHVNLSAARGGKILAQVTTDGVSVEVVTDCFFPRALRAELS